MAPTRNLIPFAAVAVVILGAVVASCHPPEGSPVPPRPTDPTNVGVVRTGAHPLAAAALSPLEETDASIVVDAGTVLDAGIIQPDAAPAEPQIY
jgi:hypothetical protein